MVPWNDLKELRLGSSTHTHSQTVAVERGPEESVFTGEPSLSTWDAFHYLATKIIIQWLIFYIRFNPEDETYKPILFKCSSRKPPDFRNTKNMFYHTWVKCFCFREKVLQEFSLRRQVVLQNITKHRNSMLLHFSAIIPGLLK